MHAGPAAVLISVLVLAAEGSVLHPGSVGTWLRSPGSLTLKRFLNQVPTVSFKGGRFSRLCDPFVANSC